MGSVRRPGKSPERGSSFSQTCSRFSQYLQTGGGLEDGKASVQPGGALSLFFSNPVGKSDASPVNFGHHFDVLPQLTPPGGVNHLSGESLVDLDARMTVQSDPETAQMTIFYGGKVVVYDAFPADKANMIMEAAKKASTTSTPKPIPVAGPSSSSDVQIQDALSAVGAPPDLPRIARRASLRRFLEKRRDRYEHAAKAPYDESFENSADGKPDQP